MASRSAASRCARVSSPAPRITTWRTPARTAASSMRSIMARAQRNVIDEAQARARQQRAPRAPAAAERAQSACRVRERGGQHAFGSAIVGIDQRGARAGSERAGECDRLRRQARTSFAHRFAAAARPRAAKRHASMRAGLFRRKPRPAGMTSALAVNRGITAPLGSMNVRVLRPPAYVLACIAALWPRAPAAAEDRQSGDDGRADRLHPGRRRIRGR